ncbi:hypothetical protein AMST5_00104 [freshwater sediment metagenome]|uniref:Uncharacterized protein n=1 Tax=freshwater sediment metagenome TaxID=556182 RepID=A0AA48LWS7_9ZZZZ
MKKSGIDRFAKISAATSVAFTALSPAAQAAVSEPTLRPIMRVESIKLLLSSSLKVRVSHDEKGDVIAQWINFPNWPNWGNWGNWRNF